MKQFIWMLSGIFLLGLLLGTLSACGADPYSEAFVTTKQPSEGQEDSALAEDGTMPDGGPADTAEASGLPALADTVEASGSPSPEADPVMPVSGEEARRLAYGKALWDAYLKGVLPDGTKLDWTSPETAAKYQFAVCDVDGDGEDELLLYWTTGIMAGMRGIVFGCRDGAVYEELSEFPSLTFYANGTAEADWSHNQGLGGRFWPFNAYRYNAGSGVYEALGSVDAWDIGVSDTDYEGNPFPHGLDGDGDGLVYYLLPADWAGQYSAAAMVDGPDFRNWQNAYLDSAEAVSIPWQDLTEENIAALGYPKPDVEYPEPLG